MAPRSPTNPLHSRIVRLAALILPVLSIVLLSVLFLLARSVNPDDAIPFATVDVSERARDQQLTGPHMTGLSSGQTAFDLTAARAIPDGTDPRRMRAEDLRVILDDADGGQTRLNATLGDIDSAAREVVLTGEVTIETSTGYTLRSKRMEGSLETLMVVSPGAVTGTGPLGDLQAGSMSVREDEFGATQMLFTDGVILLYTPPS